MRSITRLLSAFGSLADSILGLSAVVNSTTDKLRLQLASETEPPALAHNGEVIDAPADGGGNPSAKRGRKATA